MTPTLPKVPAVTRLLLACPRIMAAGEMTGRQGGPNPAVLFLVFNMGVTALHFDFAKYTDILHSQWSSRLPKIPQTGSYKPGTAKAPESRDISDTHLRNKLAWQTWLYSKEHFRSHCIVLRRKVKITSNPVDQ